MPDLPLRGRAEAIAEIDRLLAHPGRRLLTVTGLPGVGKSRLVREYLTNHSDGPSNVVFVRADQVYEPGLLGRRIRGAVGIPPEPAEVGRQQREVAPAIVLVDDAHRADDAAAALRELLEIRHDLRLVVTARAPFHIPGETVFRLDPFPVPDPERPAVELAEHPSVQLFVDVAAATGTSADTGGEALTTVARICALVGGLPLAIELAAAHSAAFSPTSLLRLLTEQPHRQVLGGEAPGRAPDDHSLFDAIAWTESLLSAGQQTLLHQLTVFLSPVPVDAIAAVTGTGDVVEGLSALVDMHLVQADHTDGATRFSLHPLVREHALERLQHDSPELVEELHAAHIRWALTFITPFAGARTGMQFIEATERLRPVGPDLRLALHRALDREDAQSAVTLGLGLAPYWFSRGAPPGHNDLLTRIQALPGIESVPAAARAMLAGWHGLLRAETARTAQEVTETLEGLLAAVELARSIDDEVLVRVIGLTVRASRFTEHREWVRPLCDEGRELARALGWPSALARFEIWTGMLAHQAHDTEGARRWGLTAYRRAQAVDDPTVLLTASGFLHSLPGAASLVPDLPSYEDLLALARRTGDRHAQSWIQPLAAHDALRWGDLSGAASHAAEVIGFGRAVGAWGWCGVPLMCLAKIASVRGDRQQEARFHGMLSLHLPVLRPSIAPWVLQAYEETVADCRASCGPEFDHAHGAGASLTHRAAAEEGLQYADSVTRSVGAASPSGAAPHQAPAARTAPPLLTAREQEVLALLAAGGTNKEISAALGISPKTVMHHTSNIYRKLEVRGRAQAVAWHLRRSTGQRTPGGPGPLHLG